MEHYFVEYELFGSQKNISFNTFNQYTSWAYALSTLNDEFIEDSEHAPFKIFSVKFERID